MRRHILAATFALTIGSALSSCAPSSQEAEVRTLVEHFGSRLQLVGLNSPSVAEDMRAQYADLVDPSLLEEWLHAPTTAPGRAVSSPWPDRIEITSIEEVSPGLYSVSAEVVELTSYELTHGGAAARIPVTLAVRQLQGQWLITGYTEQDL